MVSPLFQVFSMERALSTPFSFAQTFAAARAVLFSPNSTTVYKLPSNLMIMPRLMSAVFAIRAVKFLLCFNVEPPPEGGAAKKCSRIVFPGRGQIYIKNHMWRNLPGMLLEKQGISGKP